MAFLEQEVEALVAIGLTRTQAKVYLTLARMGKTNAKTIWKNSGVARQDIYRILTELQEKTLVEKIVAAPTEFRAIALRDGLSVLLKHKAYEYKEIEKKTKELLDGFITNHPENTTAKEGEIIMITTKDANLRRIHESLHNTKKSLDVIDSWESFKRAMVVYAESSRKGLKKKVKFRFITDKPEDGETVPKIIQTLKKNSGFELRHIPTRRGAPIRIEDGRQVTICIMKASYTPEAPSLFSDNPCLVAILQDYFELLWNNSTKDNT
jgi:sugar-specific transcriptional regulator TrmB